MREIKFRMWDGHSMDYDPRFSCDCADDLYGLGVGVNYGFETEQNIYENIFMQYTGLKDKKGKEIYEGDILEGGNGGEVFWDNELAGFYIKNFHAEALPFYAVGELEVIGNIYENNKNKN